MSPTEVLKADTENKKEVKNTNNKCRQSRVVTEKCLLQVFLQEFFHLHFVDTELAHCGPNTIIFLKWMPA